MTKALYVIICVRWALIRSRYLICSLSCWYHLGVSNLKRKWTTKRVIEIHSYKKTIKLGFLVPGLAAGLSKHNPVEALWHYSWITLINAAVRRLLLHVFPEFYYNRPKQILASTSTSNTCTITAKLPIILYNSLHVRLSGIWKWVTLSRLADHCQGIIWCQRCDRWF